jgi:hypothetical protein
MKKFKWLSIVIPILVTVFIWFGVNKEGEIVNPLSTNYENATDSERDDWIEGMHETSPGKVGRRMDQEFRLQRYKNRLAKISDVDLEGTWVERGSNNLSGRMRTSEVDFDENLIYTHSSGGNIWVGTLEGNNWECINEQLQINSISMIRRVPHNSGNKIIVDQFYPAIIYYTDDQGVTWNQGTGLDDLYKNL